jgi:L-lactate dehydrogenase complex protein LldG
VVRAAAWWLDFVAAERHHTRTAEGMVEPARIAGAGAEELSRAMAGTMSAREAMLGRIRAALGRKAGDMPPEVGTSRISVPSVDVEARIAMFSSALEKLAGKPFVADSYEDARNYVASVLDGRTAVSSDSPLLHACGVACPVAAEDHRKACAESAVGITSAAYALADTGSLVMLANSEEARLVSLLPPVHIAVIEKRQILTGLDELLTTLPLPADVTSSMVLITGTSRTADIEQILVRGVHGPGELHVVVV